MAAFLIDMEGRQVKSLQLTGLDDNLLSIEKGLDGSWEVVEPGGMQADPALVEQLLADLGMLQISTELETTIELKNLGLDPAAYEINVDFENGNSARVFIGDQTPTQEGYYAYREGEKVAVADQAGIDSLIGYLSSPPVQNTPAPISTPAETSAPQP
jgi:hypothetical protein